MDRYESLGAFFADMDKHPAHHWTRHHVGHSASWCPDYAPAKQKLLDGAGEAKQKPIRDLIARIDAGLEDRTTPQWIDNPIGSRVNVPRFLQGHPYNMGRRMHVESEKAPVKIVVEIGVSQGVEIDTLNKRGAAIAALAMRMSEQRATELYICAHWAVNPKYGRMIPAPALMVRVGTMPISLAELAALIVEPFFARAMTFTHALVRTKVGPRAYSSIAWPGGQPGTAGAIAAMRRNLELAETDIFIPGGHLTEQDEMIRSPVAWVHKYLEAQRTLD